VSVRNTINVEIPKALWEQIKILAKEEYGRSNTGALWVTTKLREAVAQEQEQKGEV